MVISSVSGELIRGRRSNSAQQAKKPESAPPTLTRRIERRMFFSDAAAKSNGTTKSRIWSIKWSKDYLNTILF